MDRKSFLHFASSYYGKYDVSANSPPFYDSSSLTEEIIDFNTYIGNLGIQTGLQKRTNISEKNYMAIGMSLGICFGVAGGIGVGICIEDIGICIGFGICIGMIWGTAIGSAIKKNSNNNSK